MLKYFKCLASHRYSVNRPLFTFGFCHKDSWVILSGICPLGNGGGREVPPREGWRAESRKPVRNVVRQARPATQGARACGSGEGPAQCRLYAIEAAGKLGGGARPRPRGNKRMVILRLPPCGPPTRGWFRTFSGPSHCLTLLPGPLRSQQGTNPSSQRYTGVTCPRSRGRHRDLTQSSNV